MIPIPSLFQNMPPRLKAILFGFLGFSCFATGDAIYKWLGQFHPITSAAFFGAGSALLVVMIFHKYLGGLKKTFESKQIKLHAWRGAALSLQFIFILYAFQHMPLTEAYVIIFLSPVIAVVLSSFIFKEKLDLTHGFIIILAFAGVLLGLRPDEFLQASSTLELLSLGAALMSAVLVAVANLLARKIKAEGETILSFMIYALAGSVIVSVGLGYETLKMFPLFDLGAALVAGLLSGLGMVLISKAFSAAPVATIAPLSYGQFIWGIFYGYILFGDSLDLYTALGAALVIISGLVLIYVERRKKTA